MVWISKSWANFEKKNDENSRVNYPDVKKKTRMGGKVFFFLQCNVINSSGYNLILMSMSRYVATQSLSIQRNPRLN